MRRPSLVILLLVAACSDSSGADPDAAPDVPNDAADAPIDPAGDETASGPDGEDDPVDVAGDVSAPPELVIDESSFGCLTEWTAVRGFYLTNLLDRLDEAVEVAEAGFVDQVPPGTIVQLVPIEAMVKLRPGTSPETNDWEFFLLQNSTEGTEIVQRGGAEVENLAGSCLGCHVGAIERDMICEDTGLCAAAALPRDLVDAMVGADPRCP